jgi:polar amino acid transport system substrate-binding protein
MSLCVTYYKLKESTSAEFMIHKKERIMKQVVMLIVVLLTVTVGWVSWAETNKTVTIVVATDPTNPPMQMLDSAKQITGFDIEVMNAAAKAGGFKARFISVEWDSIFSGLLLDKYDAIMSSVTITSERLKTMDFSVPYLVVGQVMLVRTDAKPIGTFKDLSGKVVGVLSGSTSETELNKSAKANGVTIKKYGDLIPMFAELVEKKIDAFFCDDYYAAGAVQSQDPKYKNKIKIAGPALTQEDFGIVVKKGNSKVLQTLNIGLKKVLQSEEYVSIKKKWLK